MKYEHSLRNLWRGARASVLHNTLGLEPLYAVSHVSQLSDKDLYTGLTSMSYGALKRNNHNYGRK